MSMKLWVCSFRLIQKWIFDPRFTRFRGQKEREIGNWICVTFVTFRKRVQYHGPLSRNDVFSTF